MHIDVGSHIHTEPHWEDGSPVDHVTYFAVAVDDAGHRWHHRHAFGTEAEADRLARRIDKHLRDGGNIDLDHWVEADPVYGSQAYIEFERDEIAPHAYALSQGWEREGDLPDSVRGYF